MPQLLQHLIARLMAQIIIDQFEIVHIHHEQCAHALLLLQIGIHTALRIAAVAQIRQRITLRPSADLQLLALLLINVFDIGHQAPHLRAVPPDRRHGDLEPQIALLLVHDAELLLQIIHLQQSDQRITLDAELLHKAFPIRRQDR